MTGSAVAVSAKCVIGIYTIRQFELRAYTLQHCPHLEPQTRKRYHHTSVTASREDTMNTDIRITIPVQ
jgi:hypothetical protein